MQKLVKRFNILQMTINVWTCKSLHTGSGNKVRDTIVGTVRPSNTDFVVKRYFREMRDSGLIKVLG